MAVGMLKDVGLTINSVDLSDHCTAVSLNVNYDDLDVTAFTHAIRQRVPGLGDGQFTATMLQNYAASKTYATIQPLAGTTTTITLEPDSGAATSATNPTWTFDVACNSFDYLTAGVGAVSTVDLSWPLASQITIDVGA